MDDAKSASESGHSSFLHVGPHDFDDKFNSLSSSYLATNFKDANVGSGAAGDTIKSGSSSFLVTNVKGMKVESTQQNMHQTKNKVLCKEKIDINTSEERVTDLCAACISVRCEHVDATHFCQDCGQRGRYLCEMCIRFHDFYVKNHNLMSLSTDYFSKSCEVPPFDTVSLATLTQDDIDTESEPQSPRTVIYEQVVQIQKSINSESDKSILILPCVNVRQFVKKFEALKQPENEKDKACYKLGQKQTSTWDELTNQNTKRVNHILSEEEYFSVLEHESPLESEIERNEDRQKNTRKQRISRVNKSNRQYVKLNQLFVQPAVNNNDSK